MADIIISGFRVVTPTYTKPITGKYSFAGLRVKLDEWEKAQERDSLAESKREVEKGGE
jgi:hypothetical protein